MATQITLNIFHSIHFHSFKFLPFGHHTPTKPRHWATTRTHTPQKHRRLFAWQRGMYYGSRVSYTTCASN